MVKKYRAKRKKNGEPVEGYAAMSLEADAAWLLIPSEEAAEKDTFHIVEVDIETLEEID